MAAKYSAKFPLWRQAEGEKGLVYIYGSELERESIDDYFANANYISRKWMVQEIYFSLPIKWLDILFLFHSIRVSVGSI